MNSNKKECKKICYNNERIVRGTTISLIVLILAIYLSYMCNKGFKLSSMFYAICFSPYYVIYRLIKGVDKCFK